MRSKGRWWSDVEVGDEGRGDAGDPLPLMLIHFGYLRGSCLYPRGSLFSIAVSHRLVVFHHDPGTGTVAVG